MNTRDRQKLQAALDLEPGFLLENYDDFVNYALEGRSWSCRVLRVIGPNRYLMLFSYNEDQFDHSAGKADYIRWYGEQDYCTGNVHGHVWFFSTEDGLEVRHSNGDDIDEEEWERLEEVSVHDYSAELRWFAIVDAEDLPKDVDDDLELGFFDLEPGEYEFTSYPVSSNGNIAGTLKRIPGSNEVATA